MTGLVQTGRVAHTTHQRPPGERGVMARLSGSVQSSFRVADQNKKKKISTRSQAEQRKLPVRLLDETAL